jgi:hypothetical protein
VLFQETTLPKRIFLEGNSCSDDDDWTSVCETLTEAMGSESLWYAEVRNFGWNNRSGYKFIEAHSGAALLRELLPDTLNSFKVYKRPGGGFYVNNAHHDKLTGGEIYTIVPNTPSLRKKLEAIGIEASGG